MPLENQPPILPTTPIESSNQEEANWLRALEAQSWQAELLISGLVIAGLIRVPDLFIHWVEGYIVESTGLGFLFLNIASLFVLAAVDGLIAFFAIHFLFRTIWIALLGLNSVYPNGINIHSTQGAGAKYWKKSKEKYPSLSLYNQKLDNQCSLIFSLATVTIIMMTSFSVIILVLYQFFRFLISLFPIIGEYIIPIGVVLYVLFLVVSFGSQHLAKKYGDNKRVEKYLERYGKIVGGIFSLYIFEKPVGYITGILVSNSTSKLAMPILMLFMGILGFTSAMQTNANPILSHFSEEEYFTFNNRPHRTFDFNYENLRSPTTQIFTPIIESDAVYGKVLKLFIPIIEREEEAAGFEAVGIWERLTRDRVDRDAAQQSQLKTYADFNQVFVNDIAYPTLEFQYYHHPNKRELGLLTYIPTDQFLDGKNLLEIRKNYFSQDSIQKIVAIPFYFE